MLNIKERVYKDNWWNGLYVLYIVFGYLNILNIKIYISEYFFY